MIRRAGEPVFDAVIEVEGVKGDGGGEDGQERRWRVTVVTDVGGVVDELLATGRASRSEMRMPLVEREEEEVGLDGRGRDHEDVFHEVRVDWASPSRWRSPCSSFVACPCRRSSDRR